MRSYFSARSDPRPSGELKNLFIFFDGLNKMLIHRQKRILTELAELGNSRGKSNIWPAWEHDKTKTLPIRGREHDFEVPGYPFCHPWQNP